MEIPHSLHSRFLLSLLQALSLFFHCPHLTPPNSKPKPLSIQLMSLIGLNLLALLFLWSFCSPVLPLQLKMDTIRARFPSSSFPVTHVSPTFATCSHSVWVPLLSLSTQPNSITFFPLYKDARLDGLVRIHVPFSLSDLSQIEKGLGSYNGNSSTFIKKFQHITESYNLTWHYQQLSPWGSASELSLRTG